MNALQALILGLIQGLTEFLPVSSSGHLVIAQNLLGLDVAADNLLFDIVVHAATVLSIVVVLRTEIWKLLCGTFTPQWNWEKSYVLKLVVSMIPVMIVGLFFKDLVEGFFGEGLTLVGCCLLITALLLTFSFYAKPKQKAEISYLDAFVIGIAQAVAVLPGLSRSGSTIATGLLLGNKKEDVAKFSFLMVMVPVLGEALLSLLDLGGGSTIGSSLSITALLVGFLAAFLSGCFACKFMIELVKRGKLIYFAIYCALIGLVAIIFG